MSVPCKLIAIAGIVALAALLYTLHELTKPLAMPTTLSSTQHWGPGRASVLPASRAIVPKRIQYSQTVIDDLRRRLNDNTIVYHPALTDAATHAYGLDADTLLECLHYWGGDYLDKWPERENLLNQVPHFETQIQGLNIHFIHLKPTQVAEGQLVVPLLLLHGWPGSVREFYDLFPMLTTSDGVYVFEVIAPSLPGYGWSDGPAKTGFGPAEAAVVMRNLMLRLGHRQFYVQGGDWGSIIGSHLATLYPQNVRGYHSNFCMPKTLLATLKLLVASLWPTAFVDARFAAQVFPLADKLKLIAMETGSFHMQATKPETLSAVLYEPIALCAYLLEKFVSAVPGHDRDAVLDNIMIYFLTQSFTSSARMYAEDVSAGQAALELWRVPTAVPTGCARFQNDIGQSLDWQLRDKYTNLVHSSWFAVGGHFAAMEVPAVLYADLVAFVATVEKINNDSV